MQSTLIRCLKSAVNENLCHNRTAKSLTLPIVVSEVYEIG